MISQFITDHLANAANLAYLALSAAVAYGLRKFAQSNKRVLKEIAGEDGKPDSLRELLGAQGKLIDSVAANVRDHGGLLQRSANDMEEHRKETRESFGGLNERLGAIDSRVHGLDERVRSMEGVVMKGHETRITNLESERYQTRPPRKPLKKK